MYIFTADGTYIINRYQNSRQQKICTGILVDSIDTVFFESAVYQDAYSMVHHAL